MSNIKALDKLRELAADINSTEIIAHIDVGSRFVIHTEWLDSWHKAFDAACDEIEAEIAERYMELPTDDDGVPIHVGDCLQLGDTRSEVVALTYCPASGKLPWEWQCDTGDWYNTAFAYHVKPRTIEDVLTDFANEVARQGHQIGLTGHELAMRYADEIRELMGVGE